ncbi:hypothetical protein LXL04_003269 [Taraxacum kok-saghyz]
MPTYETTGSYSPIHVFRSSLVFNGVSYSGDECKSKKEAEQSAARAVILKCLAYFLYLPEQKIGQYYRLTPAIQIQIWVTQ